jgi:glycosyltransferase involved in cell wall biosynthesis
LGISESSALPFVSVLIPVRNERHHISRCLEGVLSQDYPQDRVEVLVADAMSSDGTRNVLAEFSARDGRLRVIDNPERIASTGLNAAVRSARGEVIVRMDAHTEYAQDYVRECVTTLLGTEAASVGGPARTKAETYLERAVAAAYHSRFAVGGARFHQVAYEGYVDTVTYGCWRKTTFDLVGLFDEELVRNQDDEHNLRLTRAGEKVWQSPRIRSWYRPRGSLPALFRQYMQYGYWKVRVIQKHKLPASVRHLIPGCFVATVLFLGLAAPFALPALWAWAGLVGLYAFCVLGASAITAWQSGMDLFPVLPAVFWCYHFGYGYGFLRGVVDFFLRGSNRPSSSFTMVTRTTGQTAAHADGMEAAK